MRASFTICVGVGNDGNRFCDSNILSTTTTAITVFIHEVDQ
jgi:hypothetical protein